jgi:hypothetical protein
MSRKKIGEILIEKGYLDASELSLALELKRQSDKKNRSDTGCRRHRDMPEQVSEAFSEQTGYL